jgi:hypothetical protein
MSIHEFTKELESAKFAAEMSVFSGFKTFVSALNHTPILDAAINLLLVEEPSRQIVFERISELIKDNPEPEYSHPHDIAIACYLYMLSRAEMWRAELAAIQISEVNNLFWAKQLARQILNPSVTSPTVST